LLAVSVLGISGASNLKESLVANPTAWAYNMLEVFGTVFQIGSGIFLLIFGARLIAMEYSSGTIRILYARGTGRLRLLLAKLFTLALVGIMLFAGYVLVVGAILALIILSFSCNFEGISQISNAFWSDLGRCAAVQGISMGMAILLAPAASAPGRALAACFAASRASYPPDYCPVLRC